MKTHTTFQTGNPQTRIKKSLEKSAPIYRFYSQEHLEADLHSHKNQRVNDKLIHTFDDVQLLSEGDLIYSMITGQGAIVSKEHADYLFTQNFVKITPHRGLSKKYLLYLLNESKNVKKQIVLNLQGSLVRKVTISVLKDIVLPPLPNLERQELIGGLYLNQLRLETLKKERRKKEHMLMMEKLKRIVDEI
ncbi:restriction endonuclease subunit M [Streptococcus dentiloxodontae]